MKKAVIYARFSTEMQREGLSIESQVFRCTEFITRNGWTVAKVYSDEAKSGQYSTRTAFNQIIDDAKLGQFDIVVIDAITRASRFEDFFQYYSWKNQLENCNVKLESATENITDDSIGDLVEFMALWKSKQEIKTIRSNVKRAMDLNASQAKFNGGNIPIGFDIDKNNMYVKNENEAKIVNLIFDLYLEGKGYKQIADTLNSNGYRKKNGGLFVPLPIRDILLNEKYVGTYTYNKNLSRNKFGARKGEKPIAEQVIMPGALPVIVEKEKFNKVKNIMESKTMAKNTATAKDAYLLSGLLKCGECGYSYSGHYKKARDRYYYECIGNKHSTNCKNPMVARDEIEATVIEYLINFTKDKSIEEMAKWFDDAVKNISDKQENNSEQIKKQITLSKKEVNKMVDKLLNFDSETLKSKILIKENEINDLQSRLDELNLLDDSIKDVNFDTIKEILAPLENLKSATREEQKRIIRIFIKEIIILNPKEKNDRHSEKRIRVKSRLLDFFKAAQLCHPSWCRRLDTKKGGTDFEAAPWFLECEIRFFVGRK